MHINTLLHHLFLHRTAQQARHYLCFSRVCLYAQRGGRMCGCEALKCESLRKLSEILRRTPIVYRNHGPKFRKPRHFFLSQAAKQARAAYKLSQRYKLVCNSSLPFCTLALRAAIGLYTGHLRRMHLLYCEACTCATRTPSCVPQTPACLPQLCGFFPYIYLSSTRTSLFWAMKTCADEACSNCSICEADSMCCI